MDVREEIKIIDHTLVRHKLALLRDTSIQSQLYSDLTHELSLLLGAEALRDLPMGDAIVNAAFAKNLKVRYIRHHVAAVAILRSGLVMANAMRDLLPVINIGHLGLQRSGDSVIHYFTSLPGPEVTTFVILDAAIGTGLTMRAAADILRDAGVKSENMRFVAIIASRQGIETLYEEPENIGIPLFLADIDPKLNEDGLCIPGIGHAADRLFGTGDYVRGFKWQNS
jgi:uracil phosphoribosyltransferase